METAENLLNELGAQESSVLLVFNKTDRLNEEEKEAAKRAWPGAVFVSCKKKEGMEDLRRAIIARYESRLRGMSVLLNYDKAPLLSQIRKNALVVSELYEEDGIRLELRVFPEKREQLMQLLNGSVKSGV